jgi:hypothetical protein
MFDIEREKFDMQKIEKAEADRRFCFFVSM